MSPEQKKYYCDLLEHAPEKLLEDLAWLYDTRNVAIQRHAHAMRERERWHGKYMMVKHENNALRSAVHDIAKEYQVITECPNCQHLQRIVISFNHDHRYYCEECATEFALNFSDPPANRRMHLIYFAARCISDAAPHH